MKISRWTAEGKAMKVLSINGQEHRVDVPDHMPLLWVLRDILGLIGTKYGCGIAQCGACTVHVDGEPLRSTSRPAHDLAARARLLLFAFMLRNAVRAVDLFRIPTENLIEMGRTVEI